MFDCFFHIFPMSFKKSWIYLTCTLHTYFFGPQSIDLVLRIARSTPCWRCFHRRPIWTGWGSCGTSEGFWICPVASFKHKDQLISNVYINISDLYTVYSIQTYQSMDFMVKKYGRFVYIHLYTFVTNQSWFNCDLKTHHPWRALSCWPSTWGDSCILTTLRVLTRRGLDSTFSGRLAAACQQGLIPFHDIMTFPKSNLQRPEDLKALLFWTAFLAWNMVQMGHSWLKARRQLPQKHDKDWETI